jgi:hypothetical protein
VDKMEDDFSNLDDMFSPDDASLSAEEPVLAEAKPTPPEESVAETAQPEPEEEVSKKGFDEKEKADKNALLVLVGIAVGVPVVLVGLGAIGFLYFATAAYLSGLAFIGLGIWAGRKTNTLYVIFLGCVLAAILTSIYCLWMKLDQYHFDVKAQAAKQLVSTMQPTEFNNLV